MIDKDNSGIVLKASEIRPLTKEWRQFNRLYKEAFPENERISLFKLYCHKRHQGRISMKSFYMGEIFCGLVITAYNEKYLYIPFLAVAPEVRGKGIGGAILSFIRQEHPGLALLVEVETPDPAAPNLYQRRRRIRFYERNGFLNLERTITGRGETYCLYATDTDYDKASYLSLLHEVFFSFRASLGRKFRNIKHPLSFS